ncbi:MAG: PAS domain S-box protein [Acidobacteriota bacterium]
MARVLTRQSPTSRHQAFMRWLDAVSEPLLAEWVDAIREEIPAYATMEPREVRLPVERHFEALRYYWDLGLQSRLYVFYQDLARKRLAEKVRLADVARAVDVGKRILLRKLAESDLPGREDLRELFLETFRENSYVLLECYQAATEEMAAEAEARLEATEADAAKSHEQWGLLNQILTGLDVGIIVLDSHLKVAWLNQNVPRDLLRIRPELAMGLPCQEALAHDAAECSRCSACYVLQGATPMRQLIRAGAGKNAKDYLKITRPLSGGHLVGPHVIEIYLDITAQQEAIRSLARTQELVRNILNSSVSAIISTDLHGRVTLFNRAAEKIFGFTEGEMLGQRVGDYYERGMAEARTVMRRLLSEEVITDFVTAFRARSGEHVPLKVTFSLLRDEQGTLVGTMSFCQDIRVEEALKEEVASKDQYLLSILQASMDGLVTLDAKGRIASWNRGAAALLGVEPAFALGRSIDEFLPPDLIREMPSSGTQPGIRHFEARLPKGCDSHMDILVTRTEIRTPADRERGASLVLKDVTELKRLQKDLAQAEHLAELGQLAASVAHEIKNPIAGLRGAMELMAQQHQLDDPRFVMFHEGLSQIRRLDGLVKDLLSYARPLSLQLEPVPLGLVVESTLPFVQRGAEEAGVSLSCTIPEDLPVVHADPQRLQQVIVNLVQNGIQATQRGGSVTVSGFMCGHEVALEIRDTGSGMAPEQLKKIFQPFYTTKHIGTGLGLSIVQRIVGAHGGRVEVSSRPEEGTVFTVYLPYEYWRA